MPFPGVLVSSVVLLLSQKALLKFYTLFLAILLGVAAVLINTCVAAHSEMYGDYYRPPPRNGPKLWVGVGAVQLLVALGYVFLLNLQSALGTLVVLDVMIPLLAMMAELPADAQQLVCVASTLALALNTVACLVSRLRWFYYSCRYVFLLLRHMYRIYGLQLLLEDTWKRIRFPDVLRVFWLTRITAQALILLYVVRTVRRESADTTGMAAHGANDTQVRIKGIVGYIFKYDQNI